MTRNVYDRVSELRDRLGLFPTTWEGVEQVLSALVRDIVLDAARYCDQRADAQGNLIAENEARKCAAAVRHCLLCRPGQNVCSGCGGHGCAACNGRGVVEVGRSNDGRGAMS